MEGVMAGWEKCHTFAALILNFIITMKRNVFLKTVLLAVCMLFIAVGCSKSDDDSPTATDKWSLLQGTWMLQKINSTEISANKKKSFLEFSKDKLKIVDYYDDGSASTESGEFLVNEQNGEIEFKKSGYSNYSKEATIVTLDRKTLVVNRYNGTCSYTKK